MIEASHPHRSIVRQCALLQIGRSGRYGQPIGESEPTLALMRLIDGAFLDCPHCRTRQMTRHLHRPGHQVGRNRVVRLMRKMGGSGKGSGGGADGRPLEGCGRSTRSPIAAHRIPNTGGCLSAAGAALLLGRAAAAGWAPKRVKAGGIYVGPRVAAAAARHDGNVQVSTCAPDAQGFTPLPVRWRNAATFRMLANRYHRLTRNLEQGPQAAEDAVTFANWHRLLRAYNRQDQDTA